LCITANDRAGDIVDAVLDHGEARFQLVIVGGEIAHRVRELFRLGGLGIEWARATACGGVCAGCTMATVPLLSVDAATAARCEPTTPRLDITAIKSAVAAVEPQTTSRHRPRMVTGTAAAGVGCLGCAGCSGTCWQWDPYLGQWVNVCY
jgi:hypothetical protein